VVGVALGMRGVPVCLFFVVCYCSLFWFGCILSNSAIMKSDLFCSVVTVIFTFVLLNSFVCKYVYLSVTCHSEVMKEGYTSPEL